MRERDLLAAIVSHSCLMRALAFADLAHVNDTFSDTNCLEDFEEEGCSLQMSSAVLHEYGFCPVKIGLRPSKGSHLRDPASSALPTFGAAGLFGAQNLVWERTFD